jgi:hypothetical protein
MAPMMDSDAWVGLQYHWPGIRRGSSATQGTKQAKEPLHFALPEAPEKPMDLQTTAAVPGLEPLLQIANHMPPI